MRRITTISDARAVISDWTERYVEPVSSREIQRAARALVDFLGGYGTDVEEQDEEGQRITDQFDLDAALGQEADG